MNRLQRVGMFVEQGIVAILALILGAAAVLAIVSIIVAAVYAAVHH